MSEITKEQLMEIVSYMANQITVPTIGLGGGFAPIGTIISYMGVSAPQDYLICDGQTYNIADYSDLADFFETQFGNKNHFGGDGTTTFAVPDLRGEFLRGTGENSHTNQGSGDDVGEHQDATVHNGVIGDAKYSVLYSSQGSAGDADHRTESKPSVHVKTSGTGASNLFVYTSRPTNTSVLYCIKARGKYDITRPDLWPANEEIYFGEGLYGYHATGGSFPKATQKVIVSNVLKLISYGGQVARTGDSFPHQLAGVS